MKILKLCLYMKARAEHEGVLWKMPELMMQSHFDRGCRSFFGVQIDSTGTLISDNQQPDFFKKFSEN